MLFATTVAVLIVKIVIFINTITDKVIIVL